VVIALDAWCWADVNTGMEHRFYLPIETAKKCNTPLRIKTPSQQNHSVIIGPRAKFRCPSLTIKLGQASVVLEKFDHTTDM
jgi:hypothetical protein